MIFREKIGKYGLIFRMAWYQPHNKCRGGYNTAWRNREIRINGPFLKAVYTNYFTPKISSLSTPNISEDFVCS
jgi:hypothetical protein